MWLRLLRFITWNRKVLSKALQDRVFFNPVHPSFPVENGGINALRYVFILNQNVQLKKHNMFYAELLFNKKRTKSLLIN